MSGIVLRLSDVTGPDGVSFVGVSLADGKVRPFQCPADDPLFRALNGAVLDDGAVKSAGQRLFQALGAHPDVGRHLQTALHTVVGQRYPVFISLTEPVGPEALPWEALCSPAGEFFGLDERFALARTVPQVDPVGTVLDLKPPIRIAAVLSCLDISAEGELNALRAAINQVGAEHVRLMVVASERELVEELLAEMEANTAPELAKVELIPSDLGELQDLVANFKPHLLHFFCHGSRQGSPHISLALKSDWEAEPPRISSLGVEAADFRKFKKDTADTPWLLVLNCCEGAAVGAAAEDHSLAFSVAMAGIAPAVVGMREPVTSDTANLLTKALYGKLLSSLNAQLASASESVTSLDWPQLVAAARDKIARSRPGVVLSEAAASTKEWTLPVAYVRPQEFSFKVVPRRVADDDATRAARIEIQMLLTLLANLAPGQAADLRAEAKDRIIELGSEFGISIETPVEDL
ncbi:CHAT domain-containing protein [Gordonia sp. SID5947]|uniref:CHAT domain-containing protein n=1 Tax=Gordonia sp. SID5947 TaxID=2690315 RepID=UPI00136C18E5|nr:CHAT domain-containing protein [Gordonia sp. SID5947]MYR07385.1 CHAT domain-containing protein [Gordonia sp. SID5947]